jgi:hypothetical protein
VIEGRAAAKSPYGLAVGQVGAVLSVTGFENAFDTKARKRYETDGGRLDFLVWIDRGNDPRGIDAWAHVEHQERETCLEYLMRGYWHTV